MANLFLVIDTEKVHEVQEQAFILEQNPEATETVVVNNSGGLDKVIAPTTAIKLSGKDADLCMLLYAANLDTEKLDNHILSEYI